MKNNYIKDISKVIERLGKKYPNQPISSHLSIALSDYTNFDGVSNKELAYCLEKYEAELEYGLTPLASKDDVDRIIKDAEDLDALLREDEDDF